MDLGASTTFVVEPAERDIMSKAPRNPKEPFLNRPYILSIVTGGVALFTVVITAFMMSDTLEKGRTMAFATWIMGHFLLGFNYRTLRQPVVIHGITSNIAIFYWGLGVIIALLCVLYIPFLTVVMKLVPLSLNDLFVCLVLAVMGTCWIEGYKWLIYQKIPRVIQL